MDVMQVNSNQLSEVLKFTSLVPPADPDYVIHLFVGGVLLI